jgi:hypothetical protein
MDTTAMLYLAKEKNKAIMTGYLHPEIDKT